MREIHWGRSFQAAEDMDFPTTTPIRELLRVGITYRLGTWWETRNGEIVGEVEGVMYPDCINWECFS